MREIAWILKHSKKYIPLFIIALIGSLLESAGTAGITFLVKKVVDDVFILKNSDLLLTVSSLLILFALIMQAGFFLSSYMVNSAGESIIADLRERIFRKLLFVPYNFFIKHPAGDLMSRISNDLALFKQILNEHLPKLMRDPLIALALFIVLIYRDFLLTLILFVALPVLAYMVKYFGKKKGKHTKLAQEKSAEVMQVLSQAIHGSESIRVFSFQERLIRDFKEFNRQVKRYSLKMIAYMLGNTALNYIFGYTVVAGVFLYGGIRIIKGDLTPGDFISYLTALFMIQVPIMNTQKAFMNIKSSHPLINRINFILELEEEKGGSKPFRGFKEIIEFKNVSVSVNGKTLIRDINLEIKKGEIIGIVGHTGSGKSTLVKLLPRLINFDGLIKFDEEDIREFDLKSLREGIAFASQDIFLFNDTIKNNLLAGNPKATEKEIYRALELSLCDFVFRLKDGINTVIGEKGLMLSGGERQRLAVARLFLRDPEIIILDEITSALDGSTEEKLLNNIFSFFKGKTILIVAHRMSNIKYCDRIIVMKNGYIKEMGTLEELKSSDGEFNKIFKFSLR